MTAPSSLAPWPWGGWPWDLARTAFLSIFGIWCGGKGSLPDGGPGEAGRRGLETEKRTNHPCEIFPVCFPQRNQGGEGRKQALRCFGFMSIQCLEGIFFFLSFFQEYRKYCLAFLFYVSDDNKIEGGGGAAHTAATMASVVRARRKGSGQRPCV